MIAEYFDIECFQKIVAKGGETSITIHEFYACPDIIANIRFAKNVNNTISGLVDVTILNIVGDSRADNNGCTLFFKDPLTAGEYFAIVNFYNDMTYPLYRIGYDSASVLEKQIATIFTMLCRLNYWLTHFVPHIDDTDIQKLILHWQADSVIGWNNDPNDKQLVNYTFEELNKRFFISKAGDYYNDVNTSGWADDEDRIVIRTNKGFTTSDWSIKDLDDVWKAIESLLVILNGGGKVGDVFVIQPNGYPAFSQYYTGGLAAYFIYPALKDVTGSVEDLTNFTPRGDEITFRVENKFIFDYFIRNVKNTKGTSPTVVNVLNLGFAPPERFLNFHIWVESDGQGDLNKNGFVWRFYKSANTSDLMYEFKSEDLADGITAANIKLTFSKDRMEHRVVTIDAESSGGSGSGDALNIPTQIVNASMPIQLNTTTIDLPLYKGGHYYINFSINSFYQADYPFVYKPIAKEDCIYVNFNFLDDGYLSHNVTLEFAFDLAVSDNFWKAFAFYDNGESREVQRVLLLGGGVATDSLPPHTLINKGVIKLVRPAGANTTWLAFLYPDMKKIQASLMETYYNSLQQITSYGLGLSTIFSTNIKSNRTINSVYNSGIFAPNCDKSVYHPFTENEVPKFCIEIVGARNNQKTFTKRLSNKPSNISNVFGGVGIPYEEDVFVPIDRKINKVFYNGVFHLSDAIFVSGSTTKIDQKYKVIYLILEQGIEYEANVDYFFSINVITGCFGVGNSNAKIRFIEQSAVTGDPDIATPFVHEIDITMTAALNERNIEEWRYALGLRNVGSVWSVIDIKEMKAGTGSGAVDLTGYVKQIDFDAFKITNKSYIDAGDAKSLLDSKKYTDDEIKKLAGGTPRPPTSPVLAWGASDVNVVVSKDTSVWQEIFNPDANVNIQQNFIIDGAEMDSWADGTVKNFVFAFVLTKKFSAATPPVVRGNFSVSVKGTGAILIPVTQLRDGTVTTGAAIQLLCSRKGGVNTIALFSYSTTDINTGGGGGSVDLTEYLKTSDAKLLFYEKALTYSKVEIDGLFVDLTTFRDNDAALRALIQKSYDDAVAYVDSSVLPLFHTINDILTFIATIRNIYKIGAIVFPALTDINYMDASKYGNRLNSYSFDVAADEFLSSTIILFNKNTGAADVTTINITNCGYLNQEGGTRLTFKLIHDPANASIPLNKAFVVRFLSDTNPANMIYPNELKWDTRDDLNGLEVFTTEVIVRRTNFIPIDDAIGGSVTPVDPDIVIPPVIDELKDTIIRDYRTSSSYTDVDILDSYIPTIDISTIVAKELPFLKIIPSGTKDVVLQNIRIRLAKYFTGYKTLKDLSDFSTIDANTYGVKNYLDHKLPGAGGSNTWGRESLFNNENFYIIIDPKNLSKSFTKFTFSNFDVKVSSFQYDQKVWDKYDYDTEGWNLSGTDAVDPAQKQIKAVWKYGLSQRFCGIPVYLGSVDDKNMLFRIPIGFNLFKNYEFPTANISAETEKFYKKSENVFFSGISFFVNGDGEWFINKDKVINFISSTKNYAHHLVEYLNKNGSTTYPDELRNAGHHKLVMSDSMDQKIMFVNNATYSGDDAADIRCAMFHKMKFDGKSTFIDYSKYESYPTNNSALQDFGEYFTIDRSSLTKEIKVRLRLNVQGLYSSDGTGSFSTPRNIISVVDHAKFKTEVLDVFAASGDVMTVDNAKLKKLTPPIVQSEIDGNGFFVKEVGLKISPTVFEFIDPTEIPEVIDPIDPVDPGGPQEIIRNAVYRDYVLQAGQTDDDVMNKASWTVAEMQAMQIKTIANTDITFNLKAGSGLSVSDVDLNYLYWFERNSSNNSIGHTVPLCLYLDNIRFRGVIFLDPINLSNDDFVKISFKNIRVRLPNNSMILPSVPSVGGISYYNSLWNLAYIPGGISIVLPSSNLVVMRIPYTNRYPMPFEKGSVHLFKGRSFFLNKNSEFYFSEKVIKNIIATNSSTFQHVNNDKNNDNDSVGAYMDSKSMLFVRDNWDNNIVQHCRIVGFFMFRNSNYTVPHYSFQEVVLNTGSVSKSIKFILKISYQGYFLGSSGLVNGGGYKSSDMFIKICSSTKVASPNSSEQYVALKTFTPIYIENSQEVHDLYVPIEILADKSIKILDTMPFPIQYADGTTEVPTYSKEFNSKYIFDIPTINNVITPRNIDYNDRPDFVNINFAEYDIIGQELDLNCVSTPMTSGDTTFITFTNCNLVNDSFSDYILLNLTISGTPEDPTRQFFFYGFAGAGLEKADLPTNVGRNKQKDEESKWILTPEDFDSSFSIKAKVRLYYTGDFEIISYETVFDFPVKILDEIVIQDFTVPTDNTIDQVFLDPTLAVPTVSTTPIVSTIEMVKGSNLLIENLKIYQYRFFKHIIRDSSAGDDVFYHLAYLDGVGYNRLIIDVSKLDTWERIRFSSIDNYCVINRKLVDVWNGYTTSAWDKYLNIDVLNFDGTLLPKETSDGNVYLANDVSEYNIPMYETDSGGDRYIHYNIKRDSYNFVIYLKNASGKLVKLYEVPNSLSSFEAGGLTSTRGMIPTFWVNGDGEWYIENTLPITNVVPILAKPDRYSELGTVNYSEMFYYDDSGNAWKNKILFIDFSTNFDVTRFLLVSDDPTGIDELTMNKISFGVRIMHRYDTNTQITLVLGSGVAGNYKSIKVFYIDLSPVYDGVVGVVEGTIQWDLYSNEFVFLPYRAVSPLTGGINTVDSLFDKFKNFERFFTSLARISSVMDLPSKYIDVLTQLKRIVNCFEMENVDVFKFFSDPKGTDIFNIKVLDNSVTSWNLNTVNDPANSDKGIILYLKLKAGVNKITFNLSDVSKNAFGFMCGLKIDYDLSSDLNLIVDFANGGDTSSSTIVLKSGKNVKDVSIFGLVDNSNNGVNMFVCYPISLTPLVVKDINDNTVNNLFSMFNQVPVLVDSVNTIFNMLPGLIRRIENLENPTP